jgi:hypothetical protein
MAMAKSVSTIESEMDNLSLQESSSSGMSLVPTNEELFSIGWAKALDPNSGNYYYFILDQKKIVWDNPLNPSSAYSMGESTAEHKSNDTMVEQKNSPVGYTLTRTSRSLS